ncbi:MAG: DUF4912 domain-containing protein [Spirochaetales bacterium]|nr:DUF4912 domain-containing protein [Spirochaetales bacterium]
MTRERLQSLSQKQLSTLSDKIGIDTDPEMDREALIDSILEALEEDRIEREQLNNLVVRVKEKKYDISQDEELDFSEFDEYVIPERYNETRIALLLRDPSWAYAYWEIKDTDRNKLKNGSVALRVHKVTPGKKEPDFFDIPVTLDDNSWYINLPDTNAEYFAEVVSTIFGGGKSLCRSNPVYSPKTEFDDSNGSSEMDKENLLLFSGMYDLAGASSFSRIPQRIISMLDNQYLQMKG